MLQNAYFLAKIGADTAENEHHFAEICQKLATTPRGAGGAKSPSKERASTAADDGCGAFVHIYNPGEVARNFAAVAPSYASSYVGSNSTI